MVGRRKEQSAHSDSERAGQHEKTDEAQASEGPAGSMQASAGRLPAPSPRPGQPKRAGVPAGPFAQLLGPLRPVLRASPGAVLAAALLLHGAIAADDPAGPGSGHLLAWPLTVSFLRALMAPASIQRLSTAAQAYAGVAVALAAALRQRRLQQAKREAQQQREAQLALLAQAKAKAKAQAQAQEQQQQQQGPAPMQVEHEVPPPDPRPPPPPQQAQPPANPATQGLVGAAKRKSSKPRSTQEALGAAGGAARHAGSGGGAADGAKSRRRRKQPDRLEVALDAGPSYAPTRGRVVRRNSSAHRRSPSLADILLPPEPLPRWGRQRARIDSRSLPAPNLATRGADAKLDLEGRGGLPAISSQTAPEADAEQQALAAARQAGGPLAAENDRLLRVLRSMQQQRAGLEARLHQLQQLLSAAGGRSRASDAWEREQLADAQAQVAVERRQLAAERQAFEQQCREFRRIVESLAQSVLPPGAASVVANARQAMAATGSSPASQPAARPPLQAQHGPPAAAHGLAGGAAPAQTQHGPALRPAQPVAAHGLPLPDRPAMQLQPGGQPPPPLPPLPLALQDALQGLAARPPGSWQQLGAPPPPLQQPLGLPTAMPLPGGLVGAPLRPAFAEPPGGLPPFPGQLAAAPAPMPFGASPHPAAGSSKTAAAAPQLKEILQQQQQQQQQAANQLPAAHQPQAGAGAGSKLQELVPQLVQTLMQRQQAQQQQQAQPPPPRPQLVQQAQAAAVPAPPPGQPGQQPQVRPLNILNMLQDFRATGRFDPGQLQHLAGLLSQLKPDPQGSVSQLGLPGAQQVQQQQQQQQQQQPASGGASNTLLRHLNTAAPQLAPQPPPPPQPPVPPVSSAPSAHPLAPVAQLPPALEAQLAFLPAQVQAQMKTTLGRLCADIQRGQTSVQQLVSTLAIPAEGQQRVAAMLQQMVQPQQPSTAAQQAPTAAAPASALGAARAPAATGLAGPPSQPPVVPVGSGGATPEVSPNAAVGQSAFAVASQRPLSASPVLHMVTADDVAPVHKQLPPIRTSSQTLPDAVRRGRVANQQQYMAATAVVTSAAAAAVQQNRTVPLPMLHPQQAQLSQPPQQVQQPVQVQQAQRAVQPADPSGQQAQQAAEPMHQTQPTQQGPDQLAGAKRKAPEGVAAAPAELLSNGGNEQQQEGLPGQPAAKLLRTGPGDGPAASGAQVGVAS